MTDIRTAFKRIDNILFEDAGTNGANDYMAQMSWILFLKYLDDLEDTRKTEAVFHDQPYEPLFKDEFQWDNWAAPKHDNGKPDISRQMTGDDLMDFVNLKLFPYLKFVLQIFLKYVPIFHRHSACGLRELVFLFLPG